MRKVTNLILVGLLAALAVGLIPAIYEADDGGTVLYDAMLYDVHRYHSLRQDVWGYVTGTEVSVLGMNILNNTLEKTGVFGEVDDIVSVSIGTESGMGPYEIAEEDLPEIREWLSSFRFTTPVGSDEEPAPGTGFYELNIRYEGISKTYTVSLDSAYFYAKLYHIEGDPMPDAFYRALGIESEE